MDIKYEIEPIFKIEFLKLNVLILIKKEKIRKSIRTISRDAF